MAAKQLRMVHRSLDDLPEIGMSDGYVMRTYQPGDEAAWAEIMNTGVGDWTVEKVHEELTDQPQFRADALFFITSEGHPVASACAWVLEPGETEKGYLHMVCALPEHRGKQLGYLVTLAVLHWFRDHGFKEVWLSTDDGRIPALKSYLRLGFEPFCEDDASRERWANVFEIIAKQKAG
jgi:mycothiol synthase